MREILSKPRRPRGKSGHPGLEQAEEALVRVAATCCFRCSLDSSTDSSTDCRCSSVAQSWPTLCDAMDCSTPGLPVHQQLLELAQTHVHRVGGAIQPSRPLSPPFLPALGLSQHQGLLYPLRTCTCGVTDVSGARGKRRIQPKPCFHRVCLPGKCNPRDSRTIICSRLVTC